jgi:transglutaminase-like putative cysteine protease
MSTDTRQPQLNLDELRRLKWLLGGGLALVSLWTVFFLDVEALSLVAVAGSVIIAAVAWPQLPARVPPVVWRLAVPAIIVSFATDLYFSPDTLPALIRLGILLVLYRAVSYRRKREDLQLIVLGLFLIVVAGVLTVSLGFAFLLLGFTACALGFLFVVTLIDMTERTAIALTYQEMSQCPAWARGGWRKLLGRLRQVADWRLLGFAGGLFVLVIGFSALLFIVIPRFEVASGFFLDRYITRKSRTGFTDSVKFGDVSELIRDESVAMRVDLTDSTGLRESPYWRLVALDEYSPGGFRVSTGMKNQLLRSQRVAQTLRTRPPAGGRGNPVGGTWTFYIEPGVSRYLPLPGGFASLRLRDPVPVQTTFLQNPGRGAPAGLIEGMRLVALRIEPMAMTAFQLDGVDLAATIPDIGFARLLRAWVQGGEGLRDDRNYDARIMLQGPAGPANEAVLKRIVEELTGGAPLPAGEFARRATEWLQTRHAYALAVRLPAGAGKDDIVRWLDSNEPGFCEYFAASLTVLARAAGHPARVVAGFRGGVLNGFENYFMVRNSDAHAWTEIYDGRSAWLRVDPTPGSVAFAEDGATRSAQGAQDSSWSARFDSLRVIWYRRIVNFDSRTQVQMIEQVKSFTTDSGAALRARFDEFSRRLKAWVLRPWDAARIGRLLGLAAAFAAAGWALGRLGRWAWLHWLGWRRPHEFDPVRHTAGKWLARLRQTTGDRRQRSEVREVVPDLQRLRYGRRETWPEPRGVFKRARQARRAVR